MLNSTFTVFTCISLFTKHNYRAKKLNYLTLQSSIQNEWTLGLQHNLAGLFILIADRGGDMELIYCTMAGKKN
jgi:hypothetical protein